jgi:hypothetical protein
MTLARTTTTTIAISNTTTTTAAAAAATDDIVDVSVPNAIFAAVIGYFSRLTSKNVVENAFIFDGRLNSSHSIACKRLK